MRCKPIITSARPWLTVAMAVMAATAVNAAEPSDEPALTEVIVTGSRIVLPNMTSTSPVQNVSAEEIKAGGRSDITDVLNTMPQVATNYQGQGLGNRSNGLSGAGGVANVDLRGLGPNRTLVLVNGRRLGAGSPNTRIAAPAPDIDQIPSALLERVDVLTGGASATYGSDAIAGVVNFILKKNFTGLQLDYQTSQYWDDNDSVYAQTRNLAVGNNVPTGKIRDGKNTNLSATFGADLADGLGNVTGYVGYLKNHSVPSSERDYAACQLGDNAALTDLTCGGSGNANRFQVTTTAGSPRYAVVGNQFVPWAGAVPGANPPTTYNSQQLIYFGRDNTRYNAGFMANLELNDTVKPYAEFTFMDDKSYQEIAPSGLFENSNPNNPSTNYLVNCSNPLLSTQQRNLICTPAQILTDTTTPGSANADLRIGRRNVEGGGRNSYYQHTNYRGVVGAQGDLFPGWSYDLFGQYYYTSFFTRNGGYLSFNAIDNALQVTGTAANPRCISGGTCVPYNIFTQGAVTQEQLDSLYVDGTATGNTALRTIHGDISGDLGQYGVKLPWADDGAAVNFGYEHRSEHLEFSPDAAQLSGDLAGAGGAAVAIDNVVSVQEVFGEFLLPLVQDAPGIHALQLDGGYRYSRYSTDIDTDTYKVGLQYSPIEGIRFRGGFNRAIRAPSIIELYNPQNVGQIGLDGDPCAPTEGDGGVQIAAQATLAQCALSGVTAAQYAGGFGVPQGNAGQLTQSQGGNVDLEPETADSFTVGLVLGPELVPNLTASIDYYNIKVENQIDTLDATVILDSCIFGGDPFYCSQLVRSPVNGGLNGASVASGGYIIQTNVNVGAAKVSGIDLQAGYKVDLAALGSLRFVLNGAYVLKSSTIPTPGAHEYDCAGLFGPACQGIHPKWTHNLRATWELPADVDVSATWRYLGSTKLDNNDDDETLNGGTYDEFYTLLPELPAYSYLDLSANWSPTEWISVRGGVNNILNKRPPIVSTNLVSSGIGNTYEVYDLLGMQLFAGITLKF